MHNFKYSLKILFRNRMLVFWTFAFPIILAVFFTMAFSDIENNEKLNIIDIAIVENDYFNNNEYLNQSFKFLGDEKNADRLFNITLTDEIRAKELLDNKEISGYILFADDPKIVVNNNGINQTVLKYAVEEILQSQSIIEDIILNKLSGVTDLKLIENMTAQIYMEAVNLLNESNEISLKDISNNNLSYTMIEFYTLIAMTCLYGGIIGLTTVNQNLPNMSDKGKRVAVSCVSKFRIIISSLLASYIVQFIGVTILLIFTTLVLNVNYGNNLPLIVLLTLVGSLAGLSLGVLIATVFKTNESVKTGIVISITMLGCFLSGMMGITTKYVIDKNIPILNKINPANMITDGLYSLYYYDTLDRYIFNIISLLIFSLLMIGISMFSLRRQKYDSI